MIIVFIFPSLLFLLISIYSYLVLGVNMYLLANAASSLLFSVYLAFRLYRYHIFLERKRFMFTFIELFILNFDVQKSIEPTISIIMSLFSPKEQKTLNKLQKGDGLALLEQLKFYFDDHYYESFFDMLMLVIERGGSLIKVSEVLLYTIADSEAQITKLMRIDNSYLIKFIFNWLFIMAVAVIFRFALNDTLDMTKLDLTYLIGNEIFMATFMTSVTLLVENRLRRSKNVT